MSRIKLVLIMWLSWLRQQRGYNNPSSGAWTPLKIFKQKNPKVKADGFAEAAGDLEGIYASGACLLNPWRLPTLEACLLRGYEKERQSWLFFFGKALADQILREGGSATFGQGGDYGSCGPSCGQIIPVEDNLHGSVELQNRTTWSDGRRTIYYTPHLNKVWCYEKAGDVETFAIIRLLDVGRIHVERDAILEAMASAS